MIKIVFTFLGCALFLGCASPDLDRSLVNDPQMVLGQGDNYMPVSPFSGLKTRTRVTGGTSCTTCAQ